MSNGDVTVTRAEYLRLLGDSLTLQALQAAGVDNWEGYGEADLGSVQDALAGAEAVLPPLKCGRRADGVLLCRPENRCPDCPERAR